MIRPALRPIDDPPPATFMPKLPCLPLPSPQRGSALLSVLLLFSLVILIVTQVIATNQKAIDKTQFLFDGIRARQLLPLAENLAGLRLNHHLSKNGFDSREEITGGIGVGDGWEIRYTVIDLQSRVNLNNIVFNEAWRPVIENLVQVDKKKIIPRLIDWIDEDDKKTGIHGAEKALYSQQLRRRAVANRPMLHPSEFRQIHEINDELWLAIRDKITALPSETKINVNSASNEIIDLLLVAYSTYPLLTPIGTGFTTVEEFIASPEMAGQNLLNNDMVDVKSSYWLYEILIKSPRRSYPFHTRVYNNEQENQLLILDRFSGNY